MSNFILVPVFILMTMLGAVGSLGLKKGAALAGGVFSLVLNPWFVGGGFLYFVSAVLDIWLLRYIPYVIVLPLTALTYCWSMALAAFVLKERVTKTKLFGLVLLLGGMILLVV